MEGFISNIQIDTWRFFMIIWIISVELHEETNFMVSPLEETALF